MLRSDSSFDAPLMQAARVALKRDLLERDDGQGAFDHLFQRFARRSSTGLLSFAIFQLVFIEWGGPASVESTIDWVARGLGVPAEDAFRRLDEISALAIELCEANEA